MVNEIIFGDNRETMKRLKDDGVKVKTCITSPPYYGLRDYGNDGQLGLEKTPEEYINNMVDVFRHVRDILEDDGTLWVNIGDSYAGSGKGMTKNGVIDNKRNKVNGMTLDVVKPKDMGDNIKPKDLIGIPWMLAFALRTDGWYLRQDIIWNKPNAMPESVRDRCTKSHEYVFLLSKEKNIIMTTKQ
jgi:DNA modification methylase